MAGMLSKARLSTAYQTSFLLLRNKLRIAPSQPLYIPQIRYMSIATCDSETDGTSRSRFKPAAAISAAAIFVCLANEFQQDPTELQGDDYVKSKNAEKFLQGPGELPELPAELKDLEEQDPAIIVDHKNAADKLTRPSSKKQLKKLKDLVEEANEKEKLTVGGRQKRKLYDNGTGRIDLQDVYSAENGQKYANIQIQSKKASYAHVRVEVKEAGGEQCCSNEVIAKALQYSLDNQETVTISYKKK